MKTLFFVVILLATTLSAYAQSSSASSTSLPLEIIQNKWHYVIYNTALDDDPFQANDAQRQLQKDRIDNNSQNQYNAAHNLPLAPPPTQASSGNNTVRSFLPPSTIYIYDLKVKNTGQKKIQFVEWDYVFYDADGKTELGRKHLISSTDINVGVTKKLTGKSSSPPAGIVNIAVLGNKMNKQYFEKVIIQRIVYQDGSVWVAPSN